jgi:hypothetical protein
MPLRKPEPTKRPIAWRKGYDAGLNPSKSPTRDNPYPHKEIPRSDDFRTPGDWHDWYLSSAAENLFRAQRRHREWEYGFAAGRKKIRSLKREREKHAVEDQEYEIYANLGEEFSGVTLAPE